LLSTLGIFTIFFIAHFNDIPIVPFTMFLLTVYFIAVLMAILHIIIAISPRIRQVKKADSSELKEEHAVTQPTFFGGICQFPDADAYNKCIDDLVSSDEAVNLLYVHQVYAIAHINSIKYKFVGRAVWLTVIALTSQIALIAFTFAQKMV
jgi:hypothetical protein